MRLVLVAFAWNRGGEERRKEGKGSRREEEEVSLRALSRGWRRERKKRREGKKGMDSRAKIPL